MAKATLVFENDTISVHLDCHGYWLWDNTRFMNLSMRAKTEQAAFVEALKYYQNHPCPGREGPYV